jgi:hypothetical protein
MEELKIEIAKEFNDKLGGRWIRLGPFSGEKFYDTLLEPRYQLARENKVPLHIYLDGTKGYGSSFLDQSFGELSRNFPVSEVKENIIFHTDYFAWNVKYIKEEIWAKK